MGKMPGAQLSWQTASDSLPELESSSDNASLNRLVSKLTLPIYGLVRKLGLNATDAEDVVQNSMLALTTRYAHFDTQKGRLSQWVFGIVRREVVKYKRAQGRRRETLVTHRQCCSLLVDRRSAAGAWDRRWQLAAVTEHLEIIRSEFEPRTYYAFMRVMIDGAAPAVVAKEIGIRPQTVYAAKHRVLKRLRQCAVENVVGEWS